MKVIKLILTFFLSIWITNFQVHSKSIKVQSNLEVSQSSTPSLTCIESIEVIGNSKLKWPKLSFTSKPSPAVSLTNQCPDSHTGSITKYCKCEGNSISTIGDVTSYEWADSKGICEEKKCPSTTLNSRALESIDSNRDSKEFGVSVQMDVPETLQGQFVSIACNTKDSSLIGTAVFACGVNSTMWNSLSSSGGCRQKTCPYNEFWSNGALLIFPETKSGSEPIIKNCPRLYGSTFYTGKVTMNCPSQQTDWSVDGSCTPCSLQCVGGYLDTSTCACTCRKYWSGQTCDKCTLQCAAGQGTLDSKTCSCSCKTGFTGDACDINLTPLTPAEMGFPLLYLVLFLWRNLGDLLNPTLFMIIAFLLNFPKRFQLT
eukprot:c15801_g1_i1.p1 GENE.c15801_g1_i1~~c15801_g1_i1.p1  ORF type:complete len:371 (+),score=132.50 c15801_g1_i1:29-1141(+)